MYIIFLHRTILSKQWLPCEPLEPSVKDNSVDDPTIMTVKHQSLDFTTICKKLRVLLRREKIVS